MDDITYFSSTIKKLTCVFNAEPIHFPGHLSRPTPELPTRNSYSYLIIAPARESVQPFEMDVEA